MSVPALDTAALHPATVTGYSTGDVRPFRRPRRAARPGSTPVVTRATAHHPAAWAAAVALAGGDTSRVVVRPDGSVEVVNRPVR